MSFDSSVTLEMVRLSEARTRAHSRNAAFQRRSPFVDDDTKLQRDDETEHDEELPPRVLVPWDRVSPAALQGILEEYVTREGTEYGPTDVPLEDKVRQVRRQLEKGEVVVLFDLTSQTVNLATKREAERALSE